MKQKTDIGYVTVILEIEAEVYKRDYDEAVKEKEKSIDMVKKTYLPNTPKYQEKLGEVEKECAKKISQAQRVFAEAGTTAINELRDYEMQRIQTIDETKLNKIKAIKDIPMSKSELLALVEKFGVKGDYWSSRLIQIISENNGASIEIESSFDTKMSVLDQLKYQMEEIIKYYPATNEPTKRPMVRHGYLTKPILKNAKEIFGGKMRDEADEVLADRSYIAILSKYGDIEKAFAIQNTLRNAREQVKNLLLCRLAKENRDGKISDFAVELSGNKEEIERFKNGKAKLYLHARTAVERALKATNKETVLEIVEANAENEFMKPLLEDAQKRNEYFKNLIAAEEQPVEAESEGKK